MLVFCGRCSGQLSLVTVRLDLLRLLGNMHRTVKLPVMRTATSAMSVTTWYCVTGKKNVTGNFMEPLTLFDAAKNKLKIWTVIHKTAKDVPAAFLASITAICSFLLLNLSD